MIGVTNSAQTEDTRPPTHSLGALMHTSHCIQIQCKLTLASFPGFPQSEKVRKPGNEAKLTPKPCQVRGKANIRFVSHSTKAIEPYITALIFSHTD